MSNPVTTEYTSRTARRVAPRVAVVVIAGLVVWLWGQSRAHPVDRLTFLLHIGTAVAAILYAGVSMHLASLADEGRLEDPHIPIRYALIAPATLSHEFVHATAARLVGGSVGGLHNDGGVFAIDIELPNSTPRLADAVVALAPTLVGIPLVIWAGLQWWSTIQAAQSITVDVVATVAFLYAQFFALPSSGDLRAAWAALRGR